MMLLQLYSRKEKLIAFLKKTKIKPALAITDSQVFVKADASIPGDIPLTSFSIMLARFKGDFENYLKGTPKISELKDGDRVLLLESCYPSCIMRRYRENKDSTMDNQFHRQKN